MHLQESTLFDFGFGVKVTRNIALYPPHHAPTKFKLQFLTVCREMHLQENIFFDIWVWVTGNAEYPLHHGTFSAATFAIATPKCLGGDAFTQK